MSEIRAVDQRALDEWEAFVAEVLTRPSLPPGEPFQPRPRPVSATRRVRARFLYPAYALVGVLVLTLSIAAADARAFESIGRDPLALFGQIGGFLEILARGAVGGH
jgi:hypothetical protein